MWLTERQEVYTAIAQNGKKEVPDNVCGRLFHLHTPSVPMLKKIGYELIRHSGTLLLGAFGFASVYALIAGVWDQGTLSFPSLRVGLDAMLKLIMQMDPPRSVLTHPSLFIVVYGWCVCMLGWLVVPLLVGIIIDAALGERDSESELRIRLYHYFKTAGIPQEGLDAAVDEAVEGELPGCLYQGEGESLHHSSTL